MTAVTTQASRETDGSVCEEIAEHMHSAAGAYHIDPLPGVMDYLGAHVGEELAEELWR